LVIGKISHRREGFSSSPVTHFFGFFGTDTILLIGFCTMPPVGFGSNGGGLSPVEFVPYPIR